MTNIDIFTRICILCIIPLALWPTTEAAADSTCLSEVYYIENIETSAVANTSEAARAKATANGLLQAWTKLQHRLLISNQNVPRIASARDIEPLLDYTRIVQETVLPARYQAVFDYCFDRQKIRNYFAGHNLRHAELKSGSILILPIWLTPSGPQLWREPNPWLESWERILNDYDGLLDLRLPSGLAVERAVKAVAVLAKDPRTLEKAATFAETERLLLMVMTLKQGDTSFTADIDAEFYNKNGTFNAKAYSLQNVALDPDDLATSVDNIATILLDGIEDGWRSTNVVDLQESSTLFLSVEVRSLKEWRDTLDILTSLPPVERLSVIKLEAGSGLVRIRLSGSITSLNYALESHGLTLEEDNANQQFDLSLVRIVQ